MIAFLKGVVFQKQPTKLYLDVNGVGYDVCVSTKTLDALEIGESATIITHMHFSQEIVTLFGFLNESEKSIFLRLISVSRVGPKLAIAALSLFSAQEIATAIVINDDEALSRISGMGKKTALRVILELKEKIAKEETLSALDSSYLSAGKTSLNHEAISALVALGYDASTSKRAVLDVCTNQSEQTSIQDIIKAALKLLAK